MSERKKGSWKLIIIGLLGLLIAGIGIAIFIGLNLVGGSWAWSIVAILLGTVLFVLLSRTRFANKLLPVLELLFPIIAKLREETKKRFEYQSVVDKMEYTLEFYRLSQHMKADSYTLSKDGHFSFSSTLRRELVDALLEEQDPTQVIQHCASRLIEEMETLYSPQVLTLLYQDRHGLSTLMSFREVTQDDDALMELAAILNTSGRLPDHNTLADDGALPDKEILLERGYLPTAREGFPYTLPDITALLRDLETFSVRDIRAKMFQLQKVWEITSGYLAFLVQNRAIPEDYDYTVSEVLLSMAAAKEGFPPELQAQGRLTGENQVMLGALLRAGEQGLTGCFGETLTKEERHSLNLIALGMFFTEKRRDCQNLKAAVCWLASEKAAAIQQHLAYLEYREVLREETMLDDLRFVSVKYIAEHWKDTIIKRQGELGPGYDKEIDAIQANLAEGNWWTRLPTMIEEVLGLITRKLEEGIEIVKQVVNKRPPVGEVLRRIFRGLKLETIERFLEARTMTAYLLTFDVLSGSMATLVDCLSFFKGEKYRSFLEEKGVQFAFYDKENKVEREKYIFMDYIKQCRLGIVPMGMDFETFYHEFEHDLAIVFNHRDALHLSNAEIKKFEIIIQRFGLSGRDRHGFGNFNPDDQRKHALPQIQELFASSLVPEEIIALIAYERSTVDGSVTIEPIIDGILALGSIKDFLEEGVVDLSRDQGKALTDNDQDLKGTLIQKMEFSSLRNLAKFLIRGDQNKTKAKRALTRLIRQIPEFKESPETCSRISHNYIDTLADIADIYPKGSGGRG